MSVAISSPYSKIEPNAVKIPIQINGLSNLYMPILYIFVRYDYFLISLNSCQNHSDATRCYVMHAAAKRPQAIRSSVSS